MSFSNIKLYIELNNKKLNGNEIEIFTLLSFKELIIESFKLKMDLLIARVSNINEDNKGNKIKIYSYFCANNLNRILYKYELKSKMLYKMIILNPLNNLHILERIKYFKIKYNEKLLNKINLLNTTNNNLIEDISKNIIYIKALFFATDEDFLFNNKIREYFKLNSKKDGIKFLFKLETNPINYIHLSQSRFQNNDFYIRLLHFNFVIVFVMSVLLIVLFNAPDFKVVISFVLLFCIISLILMVTYGIFFFDNNEYIEYRGR